MEIRKLFGQKQDAVQSGALKGRPVGDSNAESNGERVTDVTLSGDDRVSISPLSRQLSQVAQILGEDEVRRSKRVAELKAAVENGSYQVSSQDVAQSIVNYVADAPSVPAAG